MVPQYGYNEEFMNCILNISEATSIAFHAVIYLEVHNDRKVSTKEIAEVFKVSEGHLAKVMQRLVKAGLVRSVRGAKGGFFLGRQGNKINLLQIYELFEGPIPETNCLFHKPSCNLTQCILDDLLGNMNKQVLEYMADANLKKLAEKYLGSKLK